MSEPVPEPPANVTIVNSQGIKSYQDESNQVEQHYTESKARVEAMKPKAFTLTYLPIGSEPLVVGKLVVSPGMYYGEDPNSGQNIAVTPDDIGPDLFWNEVADVNPTSYAVTP